MPRVQVGTRANNLIELHYQGCGSQEPVGLIHGWHGFNLPPGQERNKALIKFLRA